MGPFIKILLLKIDFMDEQFYVLFLGEQALGPQNPRGMFQKLRQREQEDQARTSCTHIHRVMKKTEAEAKVTNRKEMARASTLTIVRYSKEHDISNIFQVFIHAFPRFCC
jgi:hypothetical protein